MLGREIPIIYTGPNSIDISLEQLIWIDQDHEDTISDEFIRMICNQEDRVFLRPVSQVSHVQDREDNNEELKDDIPDLVECIE